jgi:hypothetical protein
MLLIGLGLVSWISTASAETLYVDNLAVGCTDKTLFRELMALAKEEGGEAFKNRSIEQVLRGNCRFFDKGHKVVVEEQDSAVSITIRVHEFAEVGSYWTFRLFFAPAN